MTGAISLTDPAPIPTGAAPIDERRAYLQVTGGGNSAQDCAVVNTCPLRNVPCLGTAYAVGGESLVAREKPYPNRLLLVDDDDLTLELTTLQLIKKGFEVVAAPNVTSALKRIATETFDVLVTDLNMPNPADGFTVVSAMRHSHPRALILLVSGNPDVDRAMATIALEPDEILVKPIECETLSELIREKMLSHKPAPRVNKERVGAVLNRCRSSIVGNWLTRAKLSPELDHLTLSDTERTAHLIGMLDAMIARLSEGRPEFLEEHAVTSSAAEAHGKTRSLQGYTSAMLVHESRLLQVTLFETLQKNMNHLDFSLLLPDVMRIADEVDSQLAQVMVSFTRSLSGAAA